MAADIAFALLVFLLTGCLGGTVFAAVSYELGLAAVLFVGFIVFLTLLGLLGPSVA